MQTGYTQPVQDGILFAPAAPGTLEHLPSHHCDHPDTIVDESCAGCLVDVPNIKAQLLEAADKATSLRKLCYDACAHISSLEHQSSLAADRIESLERQLAEASKDAARLKWLHETNEDADGYEYGVAKMRYVECKTEWLWCLSDHSDIDAAMKEQA